jgi:hypothetical protein
MRRIKHLFTGKFKGLLTTRRREGGAGGARGETFLNLIIFPRMGRRETTEDCRGWGKKQQKRKRKRRDIKETLATRNKYVSEWTRFSQVFRA